MPSSRGASRPRMEPMSPALAGGFFAPEPAGKPLSMHTEPHAARVMPQGYSFHTPIQPALPLAPPSPRGLLTVGPQGRGSVKVTCQLLNTRPEVTTPSSHCSLGRARQSPDCRSGNAFPSREQVDFLSLGDRSLKLLIIKCQLTVPLGSASFCR